MDTNANLTQNHPHRHIGIMFDQISGTCGPTSWHMKWTLSMPLAALSAQTTLGSGHFWCTLTMLTLSSAPHARYTPLQSTAVLFYNVLVSPPHPSIKGEHHILKEMALRHLCYKQILFFGLLVCLYLHGPKLCYWSLYLLPLWRSLWSGVWITSRENFTHMLILP